MLQHVYGWHGVASVLARLELQAWLLQDEPTADPSMTAWDPPSVAADARRAQAWSWLSVSGRPRAWLSTRRRMDRSQIGSPPELAALLLHKREVCPVTLQSSQNVPQLW